MIYNTVCLYTMHTITHTAEYHRAPGDMVKMLYIHAHIIRGIPGALATPSVQLVTWNPEKRLPVLTKKISPQFSVIAFSSPSHTAHSKITLFIPLCTHLIEPLSEGGAPGLGG